MKTDKEATDTTGAAKEQGFRLDRILVAIDGSESAEEACEVAATIAKNSRAEVTILHVIPTVSVFTPPFSDEYYSLMQEVANKTVQQAALLFKKAGVTDVQKRAVIGRASIVQTIVEFAADSKSDMVIMGTRGLGGFRKITLGSVSNSVVFHAHCSVMVVRTRPGATPQIRRILVAVDGSPDSTRAARAAIALAKVLGSGLDVVHSVSTPPMIYASGMAPTTAEKMLRGMKEYGEECVSQVISIAEKEGIEVRQEVLLDMQAPAQEITDYAKRHGVDLIVVGTRGLGGFKRLLLGSVAHSVLHYADCSVLVVR